MLLCSLVAFDTCHPTTNTNITTGNWTPPLLTFIASVKECSSIFHVMKRSWCGVHVSEVDWIKRQSSSFHIQPMHCAWCVTAVPAPQCTLQLRCHFSGCFLPADVRIQSPNPQIDTISQWRAYRFRLTAVPIQVTHLHVFWSACWLCTIPVSLTLFPDCAHLVVNPPNVGGFSSVIRESSFFFVIQQLLPLQQDPQHCSTEATGTRLHVLLLQPCVEFSQSSAPRTTLHSSEPEWWNVPQGASRRVLRKVVSVLKSSKTVVLGIEEGRSE